MTALGTLGQGLRTVAGDIASGMIEIAHSGLALVGLVLLLALGLLGTQGDLRRQGETQLRAWLQARHEAAQTALRVQLPGLAPAEFTAPERTAIERATAANPKDLPRQQALAAYWLSKKYRVAPEPVAALVAEAYQLGGKAKIEPTLILAVMAIESSFNPFAQSPVGAQGLMQVMTTVHNDKYVNFGGNFAAFDPLANLRVGVKVLHDCIHRNGGVVLGLRCYVGATSDATEGGYAVKVLAEQTRLRAVVQGKAIGFDAPVAQPASAQLPKPATPNPAASPSPNPVLAPIALPSPAAPSFGVLGEAAAPAAAAQAQLAAPEPEQTTL